MATGSPMCVSLGVVFMIHLLSTHALGLAFASRFDSSAANQSQPCCVSMVHSYFLGAVAKIKHCSWLALTDPSRIPAPRTRVASLELSAGPSQRLEECSSHQRTDCSPFAALSRGKFAKPEELRLRPGITRPEAQRKLLGRIVTTNR